MAVEADGVLTELLIVMYKINKFPSDQLVADREALEVFTDLYNSAAMTEMSPDQVARRLIQIRKMGALPPLGRNPQGPVYGR